MARPGPHQSSRHYRTAAAPAISVDDGPEAITSSSATRPIMGLCRARFIAHNADVLPSCFNPLLARIRVASAICAVAMSLSSAAANASVSRKKAIWGRWRSPASRNSPSRPISGSGSTRRASAWAAVTTRRPAHPRDPRNPRTRAGLRPTVRSRQPRPTGSECRSWSWERLPGRTGAAPRAGLRRGGRLLRRELLRRGDAVGPVRGCPRSSGNFSSQLSRICVHRGKVTQKSESAPLRLGVRTLAGGSAPITRAARQ